MNNNIELLRDFALEGISTWEGEFACFKSDYEKAESLRQKVIASASALEAKIKAADELAAAVNVVTCSDTQIYALRAYHEACATDDC